MSCPCEECISYAICYQEDKLHCEDLYHYVCVVDIAHEFYGYNRYSLIVILDLFGRYLSNSSHAEHELELTSDIEQVKGALYEIYI